MYDFLSSGSFSPPSYQVRVTGPRPLRAPNRVRMIDQTRIALVVDDARSVDDLDRLGVEQLECHAGDVDGVAGHVAERAGAEVEPAAPVERLVVRVVGTVVGGPEELVPANVIGDAGRILGPADALRPDRAIGPDDGSP